MTNFLGKGIEEIAIVIASWRERGRVPFLSKALSLSLSLLIGRQLAGQSNQLRNCNCLFPLRVNIYEFLVERSGTSFPSYETWFHSYHTLLSIIPSPASTLYVLFIVSKDFSRRYFKYLLNQKRRRRERKGEEKRREWKESRGAPSHGKSVSHRSFPEGSIKPFTTNYRLIVTRHVPIARIMSAR